MHGPVSAPLTQKAPDWRDIPCGTLGSDRTSFGLKVCCSRKPNTASNKSLNSSRECRMPCEYFRPALLASFDTSDRGSDGVMIE
jgi:hypothetical protein